MEIKGVRKVVIKDVEIYKLLKQKDELISELKTMQGEIDKIAKDGEVRGGKIQKIKDKAIPKMEKHYNKIELKRNLEYGCPNCKWEEVTSFQIEGDEIIAIVTDKIDTYKQQILTAVEELEQSKDK